MQACSGLGALPGAPVFTAGGAAAAAPHRSLTSRILRVEGYGAAARWRLLQPLYHFQHRPARARDPP